MIFDFIQNNILREHKEYLYFYVFNLGILVSAIFYTYFISTRKKFFSWPVLEDKTYKKTRTPLLVCFAICSFLINFDPALSRPIDLYHEGELLTPGSIGVFKGEPYSDVWLQHGYLKNHLIPSMVLHYISDDIFTLRLVTAIIDTSTYAVFFYLAYSCFHFSFISSIVCVLLLSGTNYWLSQRQWFYFLSIIFLVRYVKENREKGHTPWTLAVSGLFSGLSFLTSVEFGIYAITANVISATIILSERHSFKISTITKSLCWYIGGCFVSITCGALHLGSSKTLSAALDTIKGQVMYQSGIWGTPYPTPPFFTSFSELVHSQILFFYTTPIVYAYALWVAIRMYSKREHATQRNILLALCIHGVISYRTCLGRSDFGHWIDATSLSWIIAFVLIEIHTRSIRVFYKKNDLAHIAQLLPGSMLVSFYIVQGLIQFAPFEYVPKKLDNVINISELTSVKAAQNALRPTLEKFDTLRATVQNLSRKDDCVYDFSNQPGLYYFLKRKPASRFFSPAYIATDTQEKEVITDILRCNTSIIILKSNTPFDAIDGIETSKRTPELYSYLIHNYAWHATIDGIELFRKKDTL